MSDEYTPAEGSADPYSDAVNQQVDPTQTETTSVNTERRNAEGADTISESEGDEDGGEYGGEGAGFNAEDFAVPEGMEVDDGMMSDFLGIANDKWLTGKDRDQAFVDLYARTVQQSTDDQHKQWDETRMGWQEEARNDREIGGARYRQNLAQSKKGFESIGTPGLMSFLEDYSLADHPEIIRLGYRVGSIVSEDNSGGIHSGRVTKSSIPTEVAFYGKDGTGVK